MSEHCLFCGQLVRADLANACQRCGAVRQTVDERRVRAKCPRCHDVRLAPFALGPVALHACARCKGSFLPASEWDVLLDAFARKPIPEEIGIPDEASMDETQNPYRAPAPSMAERPKPSLDEPVSCPTCAQSMERLEFAGMSGVIVDVCRLHGIWLDGGELVRVVEINREREPRLAVPNDQRASGLPPIEPVAIRAPGARQQSHRDAPDVTARTTRPRHTAHVVGSRPEPMTAQAGYTTGKLLHRLSAIVRSLVNRIRDP